MGFTAARDALFAGAIVNPSEGRPATHVAERGGGAPEDVDLAAARRQRIRQYVDFFNPSGLATPDDATTFEDTQAGYPAEAGWLQGYARGMTETRPGGNAMTAPIGMTPAAGVLGVWVNGVATLDRDGITGARGGRMLRRPESRHVSNEKDR